MGGLGSTALLQRPVCQVANSATSKFGSSSVRIGTAYRRCITLDSCVWCIRQMQHCVRCFHVQICRSLPCRLHLKACGGGQVCWSCVGCCCQGQTGRASHL